MNPIDDLSPERADALLSRLVAVQRSPRGGPWAGDALFGVVLGWSWFAWGLWVA